MEPSNLAKRVNSLIPFVYKNLARVYMVYIKVTGHAEISDRTSEIPP